MKLPPQPLPLRPIHVPKVWGGRALARHGRSLPDGAVGESFEASALPGAVSRVARGPLEGAGLDEVAASWGAALYGSHRTLPFLLKILDVEGPLSVQVHPGEERSRAMGLPCAKSEGWVILDAAPGSEIGLGMRPGVGRADMRRLCDEGRPADGLVRHEPMPGQLYYLESGTVHYARGGILLYEFQRPADVTLRLHDWGRKRSDGSGGSLDEALDAAFEGREGGLPGAPPLSLAGHGAVKEAGGFRIRRHVATGVEPVPIRTEGRVHAVTAVEGRLELRGAWGDSVALAALETALVPAAIEAYAVAGSGVALACEVIA